jgi:hypothetical protein
MKRLNVWLAIALITVCGILVSGVAYAKDKTTLYAVTITNITRGQIISPPIVISHKRHFELFSLGVSASEGLAALAEDADTSVLIGELSMSRSVYDINEADEGEVIVPGASVTVQITTKRGYDHISAAGMLVTTNDAFFAVRGVEVRKKDGVTMDARAYDAGSEFNNEMCAYIPGPPCGNDGVRDTAGAEGYVYISSGIHGSVDLVPAEVDWQNPVAKVVVKKVK